MISDPANALESNSMTHITSLTFAIGAQAIDAVGRQIANTRKQVQSHNVGWQRRADTLARLFYQQLMCSPISFEMQLDSLTVIWRGCEAHAGIFYTVKNGQLQAINLLLRDQSNPTAMRQLEQSLHLIDPYKRCFVLVRTTQPPLIATFCSAQGGLSGEIEMATFGFAAVYFNRPFAREDIPTPCPSRYVAASSNRAREL